MTTYKTAIAVNGSVFLLMVGVGLIVALLPQRIMALSASVSDVGILASAYAIPSVLLQLPIGRLADRWGFKSFLIAGYLLCGLTGVLYFIADTPPLYFAGRFLQGIAEIPVWALAPALLSIHYPSQKGKYMGLYNAALHGGLTLGGLLSIVAPAICRGNEPFLIFALVSGVGGLITHLFVEDPDRRSTVESAAVNTRGLRSLIADPIHRCLFGGIALFGAGYGIFITLVPAFLIDAKHASAGTIGIFFAAFYLALSFSQLLGGRISDRQGRKPVMVAGLALAGSGIALFYRFEAPLGIVFLTLASLGWGMFGVSSMAFLNDRVDRTQKGTVSGAYYCFWGAGYFLGPLMLGGIGKAFDFPSGFAGFAGLMGLLLLAIAAATGPTPGKNSVPIDDCRR